MYISQWIGVGLLVVLVAYCLYKIYKAIEDLDDEK